MEALYGLYLIGKTESQMEVKAMDVRSATDYTASKWVSLYIKFLQRK